MLHGHKIIPKYSGRFLGDKGHKHDLLRRGALEFTPSERQCSDQTRLGRRHGVQHGQGTVYKISKLKISLAGKANSDLPLLWIGPVTGDGLILQTPQPANRRAVAIGVESSRNHFANGCVKIIGIGQHRPDDKCKVV